MQIDLSYTNSLLGFNILSHLSKDYVVDVFLSFDQTLLLIHVIPKREGIDLSSPLCQGDFVVEAVEVRRWLPEKSREESDASVKPVLNFAIS